MPLSDYKSQRRDAREKKRRKEEEKLGENLQKKNPGDRGREETRKKSQGLVREREENKIETGEEKTEKKPGYP